MSASILDALALTLSKSGLNVLGVADPANYDALVPRALRSAALMPETRSIIVVGNGGSALWKAFERAICEEPTRLSQERDPLDTFVARSIAEVDPMLRDSRRRWFFASTKSSPALDFRTLGLAAGLGARSRMGLLLNPLYGLWLGLRAACFTNLSLPFSSPAPDFCARCEAPCISDCPGNALASGNFDLARCTAFHRVNEACATTCHARLACPVAREQRYSREEITYHYHQRAGRLRLRVITGVIDDAHDGDMPFWSNPGQ